MTPDETKAAANVMLAWAAGKAIQCKDLQGYPEWRDCMTADFGKVHMIWDWSDLTYRIKPEPREWYLVFDGEGGCIATKQSKDRAEEFAGPISSRKIIHVREVL